MASKKIKYLVTIKGNVELAKTTLDIIIERYGIENIIINHLPILGTEVNGYFHIETEELKEDEKNNNSNMPKMWG